MITETKVADTSALQTVVQKTELFPAETLPEMLAPIFADADDAFCLTCHRGGAAVGLCHTRAEEMAEGVWNMLALAVHPEHQGGGCGAALVAATEAHLRARGQRMLIVDTSGSADFALTRKFYAQNGYEEEACIRDYWAPGDDKVTFRKVL